MAYTPNTWTDGDVITAEKMNNLEQGVKTASETPGTPGEPGEPGAPGAAAGFGEPTATVDANTGTPVRHGDCERPGHGESVCICLSQFEGRKGRHRGDGCGRC